MKSISLPGLRSRSLIAGALAVGTLLVAYAGLQIYAGFDVPRGVVVGEIEIGGLPRAQAVTALEKAFTYDAQSRFRVRLGGATMQLDLADAGVAVHAQRTVDRIASERWNPIRLVQMMRGDVIAADYRLDTDVVTGAMQALADEVAIAPVNAGLRMREGEPVVTPAKAGAGLDVAAATRTVLAAIGVGRNAADLSLVPVPAAVSTAAAERVRDELALPAISDSIAVTLVGETGERRDARIPAEDIAAAISFEVSAETLQPVLDGAILRRQIDPLIADIQVNAMNARFRIVQGVPTIVPSREGFGVSSQALAAAVAPVLAATGTQRAIELPFGVITPSFDTAAAEALGVTELVSSYRQTFPPAAYRTTNIGTAARYINGMILRPGETFSMNETVKERTVENGYTEGWIIGPGGVFRNEMGGAVSTITTAVFNAAWFAGVKLVEHRAHSIYMSRYPAGREATVSWGSFDMRFRNNLRNALFITAKTTRSSVTISLWGTKQWDEIGSESEARTDLRPYPTITSTDPECHDQEGGPGFRIVVWRTFFNDGVEVRREPYRTTYRPSPLVVCRADTAPVKPRPRPSATPTPSATATTTPTPSATPTPTVAA